MPDSGVIETAGKVSTSFIQSLPAQFLLLAFINVIFVLGLLWYLGQIDDNHQKTDEARIHAIYPLVGECMQDLRRRINP